MASPSPRLELRNVSRTYHIEEQRIQALNNVSLTAQSCTITAFLGRSGCGKSTLLNLAGAMDFPDAGDVLIDGRSTTHCAATGLASFFNPFNCSPRSRFSKTSNSRCCLLVCTTLHNLHGNASNG